MAVCIEPHPKAAFFWIIEPRIEDCQCDFPMKKPEFPDERELLGGEEGREEVPFFVI